MTRQTRLSKLKISYIYTIKIVPLARMHYLAVSAPGANIAENYKYISLLQTIL